MLGNKVWILLVVTVASFSSISEIFADDILVEFDKSEYDTGDTLYFSGYLVEFSMPVIAISVYDPDGTILSANNLEIDEEGTFSKAISLDSPFYDKPGDYKIKIDYQKISQEEYFTISGENPSPDPIINEKIKPEIILLSTEKSVYADGETVKITGIVSSLASTTVLIGIYDPLGTPAGFYFGDVNENLEFSTSFLIKEGVNFKIDGLYSIKAHYEESEYSTIFEFYGDTPKGTTTKDTSKDTTTKDTSKDTTTKDTSKDTTTKDTKTKDTPKENKTKDTTTKDTSKGTTTKDNKTAKSTPKSDSIIQNTPKQKTNTPNEKSIIETKNNKEKNPEPPKLEEEIKPKSDNLSVEDIELGKLLNQINLECDKSKYSDTISYYDGMGPALYRLCKFDSSLQIFSESLTKDPNNVEILTNKGSALGKLGYLDDAISHYDRALSIDPNFFPAINNKANILAKMGNHEEAISLYAEALGKNPNYHTARQNLELVLSEIPVDYSSIQKTKEMKDTPSSNQPLKIAEPKQIKQEKPSDFFEQIGAMFSSLGNILGISD